jgi:isocitrate/isopropylmalate dehydrogenase
MVGSPVRVVVIPGDGIGKEVVAEAVKVLHVLGGLDLEHLPWSADYYLQTGVTIPSDGYDTLRSFDAILVGALGDPRVPGNQHARDILLGTRFELDLYVNYRPVRLLDDRLSPLKNRTRADIDFVVCRENTEGVYRHRARDRDPGGDQHLSGCSPDRPLRVRVRARPRQKEGVHGGQEQRHDAGTRAVAARVRRAEGGVP